jgi:hypothetical protein
VQIRTKATVIPAYTSDEVIPPRRETVAIARLKDFLEDANNLVKPDLRLPTKGCRKLVRARLKVSVRTVKVSDKYEVL